MRTDLYGYGCSMDMYGYVCSMDMYAVWICMDMYAVWICMDMYAEAYLEPSRTPDIVKVDFKSRFP